MMRLVSTLAAALAIMPVVAIAQQPPATPAPNTPETVSSDRREYTNDQKNAHYIGHVEIARSDGTIYADDAMIYGDENKTIATGNVLMTQGNNRLAAERAEFDTKTGLGTFYHAWGIASVQPPRQQSARPGAAIPQVIGQETNVYFFGDKVEKLGPKKYRITNGGFSTCVQPTPRWELHADTVTLNVDHYTLLRNAIFSVKGVPMLYTPFLYYPTKRDDRATGFLIPTYGQTTIRGHQIHDAFFWAIDRSQDATFFHDWYSKTGQGVGSEYRYNMGIGSDGNIRTYLLNQHATTYAQADGSVNPVPAERSYEIRGGANQVLPGNLRLRARADYFSSIQSMQTLNTNIYDLSRNQRTFGGNLIGAWGTYTLNGTFDHTEYFSPYAKGTSVVSGTWPRITFTRNERPLLGSPLYFSVGTDVAHVLSNQKSTDSSGAVTDFDRGLSRIDVAPQIRYPFKKWQWFTVNSTTLWRETYYTRSLEPTGDPTVAPSKPIDRGLSRPVFTVQSQILGPVFNRIWDTPNNGYAEKFKHTIEPFVNVQWTAPVDNFERIITFDGIDSYVGGATYNYGLNNRFFAKRKTIPGAPAQAREFIGVELTQSYYTDQRAASLDRQYASGQLTGTAPTHFSPLALSVRVLPSNDVSGTIRAEFDSTKKQLRTVSAQGSYSWSARLQTSATWTKKAFIEGLQGFDNKDFLDHYISTNTTVHTKDNRVGGIYSFNYDVLHSQMTNQRMSGFYNAQCCGIAFEYQIYNYGANSYFTAVPQDRRFFMSFTLAGLGNFSPFNGALSGVPR
jgi:LPS-assembly protein